MERAFALFGKLSLGILIAAILISGGIYLGMKKNNTQIASPTPTIKASPSTTTKTPKASISPLPSQQASNQTVIITGNDPFSSFSISIPADWKTKKELIVDRTKVTFSNRYTSIIISQAAGGGGKCLYPGDAPSDFSSSFNTPVGITGNSGQFRRATSTQGSINGSIQTFTICELKTNNYQFPTQFGYITYQTMPTPSDSNLAKLDQIIASIKKQ